MSPEPFQNNILGSGRALPSSPLLGFLREIWRHKLVIPAVAGLVVAAVTFWTVRQPRIYQAVATLEYDLTPMRPLGSAVEDTTADQVNIWASTEFYETQNFILRSRTLAERVAQKLTLQLDADFMGLAGEGDKANHKPAYVPTAADAALRLLGAVEVNQIRDTRVVRVSVRDRSPERAQLIANTWVEAYVEKSLEDRLGTSVKALEWLGSQMQTLKGEVESSEIALYKYRESHHALSSSLDERRKVLSGQLEGYSTALTDVHTRRVQAESRLAVLRELLASQQNLLALKAGPIGADGAVQQLRARHRELTDELNRLRITYGEAHPDVRAAATARDDVFAQLEAHVAAIVASVEAELREYTLSEKGIQEALDRVDALGLELSLQEIDYTRLERERESKSRLYSVVMERAAQTDLTRALRVANARMLDPAVLPVVPISPRIQLWVTIGVLLGLVCGVLAAFGLASLDNKVRGPSDLEARGVTVLGVLPAMEQTPKADLRKKRRRKRKGDHDPSRDLIVHLEPRSTSAECCRTIRTNITFQTADEPLRTLAITSAMPREGKTTVAISVATVLAQSGKRTLLVDTDLRKPRLHRAFQLPAGAGITSVLAGETTIEQAAQTTEIPNLQLLQCGPIPPNPSELLHTRRFHDIVEEAKRLYDIVVFDTPPLGAVTDPAIIAHIMDGTLLIVRSRQTARAALDASIRQLQGVSARLLGVVLNDVNLTDSSYGTYYAYYRGYYAEDDDLGGARPRGAARTT